jgi:hypothetical protein
MIDAINLMLFERSKQLAIEAVRRGEIGPERLLDDDAPPGAVPLARKPRRVPIGAKAAGGVAR